jgi:hypothetical protein
MARLQRGQFFSADFLIAFVAVSAGLGVLIHSSQLAMMGLGQYALSENTVADTIAASLAGDPRLGTETSLTFGGIATTCWFYDNATRYCDAPGALATCVSESRSIYTAMRLVPCPSPEGYCLLTVRSCEKVLDG